MDSEPQPLYPRTVFNLKYDRATNAGMNFKWHSSATRFPALCDRIPRNMQMDGISTAECSHYAF